MKKICQGDLLHFSRGKRVDQVPDGIVMTVLERHKSRGVMQSEAPCIDLKHCPRVKLPGIDQAAKYRITAIIGLEDGYGVSLQPCSAQNAFCQMGIGGAAKLHHEVTRHEGFDCCKRNSGLGEKTLVILETPIIVFARVRILVQASAMIRRTPGCKRSMSPTI